MATNFKIVLICSGILFGIAFIFSMILAGIYYEDYTTEEEDMRTQQTDFAYNREVNCTYGNYVLSPYQCANVVSCTCSECSSSALTCSYMRSSLIAGECCDGYHCCRSEPKYCTRYDSCCRRSCSGTSDKKKCKCVGCTKRYRCGSTCVSSVRDRRCQVAVGTCHFMSINLYFGTYVKQYSKTCGRDDYGCVNAWRAQFTTDTEYYCRYDDRDPLNSVTHQPFVLKDKDEKHARAVRGLGIFILVLLILCCCVPFVYIIYSYIGDVIGWCENKYSNYKAGRVRDSMSDDSNNESNIDSNNNVIDRKDNKEDIIKINKSNSSYDSYYYSYTDSNDSESNHNPLISHPIVKPKPFVKPKPPPYFEAIGGV